MSVTTAGFRLEESGIRKLKILAVQRGTTLSAIAEEALSQWWAKQPEGKGNTLFGEEAKEEAVSATPQKPLATGAKPKKNAK